MAKWLTALFLLIWPCAGAAAEETLVGEWRGSISCAGQPRIQFRMNIKEEPKGNVSGNAEFRRGYLKSDFVVEGDGVRDNNFTLKPGKSTQTSLRIPAAEFQGEFFSIGDKIGIHGSIEVCKRGRFSAFRAPAREKATPKPPVAERGERNLNTLTKTVREGIRTLVDRRDQNDSWWRLIERGVISSRVDVKSKDALLTEVREAKANLFADALLEKELKSGPMTFPEGVGRALFVFKTARAAKDWPDSVKLRVYKECQKRVADVMRPELKRLAASAKGIPTSLDGLIEARAGLNRIDTYKASLEDAFGTVDQENILPPMRDRIAALEADPAVLEQLHLRLEDILEKPNPRAATDQLFLDISGYEPLSNPLDTVIREGQQQASLAEIVVSESRASTSPFEPSAAEIARHVFNIAERENDRLARKRCKSKTVYDPWTWSQCYLGELQLKVNRVAKHNCVEEKPSRAYTCYFDQETVLFVPRTGEVTQNLGSSTSARFTRNMPNDNWHGSELGAR